ncbi:DUF6 domain-containing protein [Histoplasma capsulatum var. duboisii H88]|uniref:DUF6 domain-containing protein n=2 Tax=Ajellomyces capsulatus TaxID=5037 RepID=F0USZ2_AJEC8|nr:DUF6 domain-containing protein [Histoplasma capsulatum H143]EGC49019.1 DUF6 domain-containing protein [Histoplasma capsulatum var. duboisii H88]
MTLPGLIPISIPRGLSSTRDTPPALNALKPKNSSTPRAPVGSSRQHHDKDSSTDDASDDDNIMATNRPPQNWIGGHRSKSQVPLLKDEERGRRISRPTSADGNDLTRPTYMTRRRSTLRSRTPEYSANNATRRKYYVASFFLVVSLKRKLSWDAFWRRHIYIVRTTAQMVESRNLHLTTRNLHQSPVRYILRTTALVATSLTVAGGSWYVAVNLTTASDLTAIYNCSAFFAYAFSIPLLNDKLRLDKVFSVVVAIVGVLVVAYGPSGGSSKNGGDASKGASSRALGNIIIGVGSVLYGLYEVLYKKLACPPEGTSPGRGVIFANTFASLIGTFTLVVLWIPLPILHILGIETFELPQGKAASLLLISVIANATFSGSFLILISLTSPVLSSVAALLTIFLVALVDWKLTNKPLTSASIYGGILIVIAFLLLSWSTYRELDDDRRKRLTDSGPDSESDV